DAEDARAGITASEPRCQKTERRLSVPHVPIQDLPLENRAVRALRRELRRGADAFDLAARIELPLALRRLLIDAELQARRAGIEYERIVTHGSHRGLQRLAAGVRGERRDGAARDSRSHGVGPARQD